MSEWTGPARDLVRVVDITPVECLGGPNDGEFRPADENGVRPNGMYIVVVQKCADGKHRIVARLWQPSVVGTRYEDGEGPE